jgi:hypothetical protein
MLTLTLTVKSQDDSKRKSGEIIGQWRTYYMSSFNDGELKNFHALATGGKLGYQYNFGHWALRAVGYYSFNTGIQDLTIPDQTTGKVSRYEAGLFDVNNLSRRVIAFPGEASINYNNGYHQLTIGRLKLLSPMLNPEDGRMIPTLEQGILYKFSSDEKFTFQLAALNAIAARSTDRFESIGESIGLYPVGRNIDGSPSGYAGNISSNYIIAINLDKVMSNGIRGNIWNYYVDNVFNTTYSRLTWSQKGKPVSLGLEWLNQHQINNGGNSIDSLTYFADKKSNVLGGEVALKSGKHQFRVGYDHILKGGRFLFPREWGRENFYTFQKRERSEGSANNHALLFSYILSGKVSEGRYQAISTIGKHWKPSVTNPNENKYAQPSYTHFNLDLFWIPEKWNGLKPELLLTYKVGNGNFPRANANFVLNKVDVFIINAIVNYNF